MRVSKTVAEKLKSVFIGNDTMWQINLNGVHQGLKLQSINYDREVFKQLDLYVFRLVNADGQALIYGSSSDKSLQPLKSLQGMYPVLYIEYAKKEGWERCV